MAQETLLNIIHRHLPEEVRAGLKGPLTLEECYQAMSAKSLGSDRLPLGFYLFFWEIIRNDLVDGLNHSYEVSTLPASMGQAMITLASKKGDKKHLSNWQSISLLTSITKLKINHWPTGFNLSWSTFSTLIKPVMYQDALSQITS